VGEYNIIEYLQYTIYTGWIQYLRNCWS